MVFDISAAPPRHQISGRTPARMRVVYREGSDKGEAARGRRPALVRPGSHDETQNPPWRARGRNTEVIESGAGGTYWRTLHAPQSIGAYCCVFADIAAG